MCRAPLAAESCEMPGACRRTLSSGALSPCGSASMVCRSTSKLFTPMLGRMVSRASFRVFAFSITASLRAWAACSGLAAGEILAPGEAATAPPRGAAAVAGAAFLAGRAFCVFASGGAGTTLIGGNSGITCCFGGSWPVASAGDGGFGAPCSCALASLAGADGVSCAKAGHDTSRNGNR